MSVKEGYDVLRLIEHGQICYISSEYVRGKPLAWYLKYHPHVSRQELFGWIQCLERQLEMLHKCRKHPCYRYVNPYSVIVSEEGELYLADMEAGSNEEMLRLMRRKSIREHFLPGEAPYYRKASVSLDAYGMGRTIQYLLAMSDVDPPLTRRETARLQKLISRCEKVSSKKAIQNLSEIRKYIPVYEEKQPNIGKRAGKVLAVAALLCIFAVVGRWGIEKNIFGGKEAQAETLRDTEREKAEVKEGENFQEKEERIELALAYFLEIEDYQKAADTLEPVRKESEVCEELAAVAGAFLEPEGSGEKSSLEEHLTRLESLVREQEDVWGEQERLAFCRCLIKGYLFLDTDDGAKNAIRLGEECLESEKLGEFETGEIQADLAAAYERAGEMETAAELYTSLLETVGEERQRREYYGKAAALYEDCGRVDMALETCIQGVEEFPQDQSLKLAHIRILCQDSSMDRAVCAQTIRDYLSRDPALGESEEFQKLQKEYGIRVEGGEVWVGE